MSDETFLARWARRKTEARKVEEPAPQVEPAVGVEEQAQAAADPADTDVPPDEETRERWIAELEKIDIDSLCYDHDFAVYMRSWVPPSLRQKALRKLWTTNPTLACLDGLNDYEEDFTDAATVVANLKSDWLPGRGYKLLETLDQVETAVADEEQMTDVAPAEQAPAEQGPGDAGDSSIEIPTVIEQLEASQDPVDRDISATLLEWQAAKRAAGRVASMGREPREIRERGAVEVISRRVRNRGAGFAEVEARHSYEAIVDRYPGRFDPEIVQIARHRLKQWRSET